MKINKESLNLGFLQSLLKRRQLKGGVIDKRIWSTAYISILIFMQNHRKATLKTPSQPADINTMVKDIAKLSKPNE